MTKENDSAIKHCHPKVETRERINIKRRHIQALGGTYV